MTPKERAAMQQALKALQEYRDTQMILAPRKAITALREALANTRSSIRSTSEYSEQEPVAIGIEWKPCMKLPVVVHVREQREGESHVSTREGITPVKPDDLIMRGVAGEEYPIGRELFNRTYTFDTAGPVRTKDLTDDEIMKINVDTASIVPTCDRQFHFARAVIAADREKNK